MERLHRLLAGIVGQLSLFLAAERRPTRRQLLEWADSMEQMAAEMRQVAGKVSPPPES